MAGTGIAVGVTMNEDRPSEHNYVVVSTQTATCKEAGVKTYTCSVCGDTYTEEIAKL